MGHTIYYQVEITDWKKFVGFLKRVCEGLGFEVVEKRYTITILPGCRGVEPLKIPTKGEGFVKTNLVEPCHSVYLLILYSITSFGSASIWED